MNKYSFLFTLLIAISVSCNDSSSSSQDTSFNEDYYPTVELSSTAYSLTHTSINEDCTKESVHCAAIYFEGELNDNKQYTAIAVKDSHSADDENDGDNDGDFLIKIYKNSDDTAYSVNIWKGTTSQTTASGTISPSDLTIESDTPEASLTRITFNSEITVGSFTIKSGDTITAFTYKTTDAY